MSPFYEYKCKHCGAVYEEMYPIGEAPVHGKCLCGKESIKKLSVARFSFTSGGTDACKGAK
jgi:putative FmdB family regulatory protein